MFIAKKPPVELVAGDILAPESINENNAYFAKAFQYEADKQTARWTTTYQLVPTVGTSINSGTANIADLMVRRVPTGNFRVLGATGGTSGSSKTANLNVESVSIVIYYTATVPFELAIRPAGTASSERIEFPIRASSLALRPYKVTRLMNLNIGSIDLFRVRDIGGSTAGLPAGVTITKFDVTFGFASDRYDSGDGSNTVITKPQLTVPYFNDADPPDAAVFSSLQTTLSTAATNAKACVPYRWCAVDFFSINNGTDLRLRTRPIINAYADASFTGVNSNPNIIGVYIEGNLSTVGTGNIQFGLADATGAYITNLNSTVAVASVFNGGIIGSTQLRPTSPDVTPITNDFYLQLTVPGTTVVSRATIYLLLQ
jgi:hypothetical protein